MCMLREVGQMFIFFFSKKPRVESHGPLMTSDPSVALGASAAHMMIWAWPIAGGHDLSESLQGQGFFSLSSFLQSPIAGFTIAS